MAGPDVHAGQLVLVLLLLMVIGFGAVASRVGVPYPIVLVVGGLAVSFVPGIPRPALEPNVVLLVFLPRLLYAGAWKTSWREFFRNLGDARPEPPLLVRESRLTACADDQLRVGRDRVLEPRLEASALGGRDLVRR